MEGGNCIRSNVRHIPRLELNRAGLRFGPYCGCLNFSVKFIPLCSSVGMFLGDLVTWTICRVRVVGQAMDRGQVIYVDEMCLFLGSGGGPFRDAVHFILVPNPRFGPIRAGPLG